MIQDAGARAPATPDPAGRGVRVPLQGHRQPPIRDVGFVAVSHMAAFVRGLPLENRLCTGGSMSWASPFWLFCGVGLCIGPLAGLLAFAS